MAARTGTKEQRLLESDLYPPVKAHLEARGFLVKGEIGAADVVAMRPGEDPVVIELKTGFSLTLFHQAVERQKITDWVYLAVPRGKGRAYLSALKANIGLCRRLGLGLITVRPDDGCCEVHADPAPYRPRKNAARRGRLLREFERRSGDPTRGGTRGKVMTAYRQDALRCLAVLAPAPLKAMDVARAAGVPTARRIMADNHFGWFDRVERGIYRISEEGKDAMAAYAGDLASLSP
ncbi:MAG: DUF2161 family putative PD-(D/E)XK-type phosphodiesterase [Pseudomonadota bacterium]